MIFSCFRLTASLSPPDAAISTFLLFCLFLVVGRGFHVILLAALPIFALRILCILCLLLQLFLLLFLLLLLFFEQLPPMLLQLCSVIWRKPAHVDATEGLVLAWYKHCFPALFTFAIARIAVFYLCVAVLILLGLPLRASHIARSCLSPRHTRSCDMTGAIASFLLTLFLFCAFCRANEGFMIAAYLLYLPSSTTRAIPACSAWNLHVTIFIVGCVASPHGIAADGLPPCSAIVFA